MGTTTLKVPAKYVEPFRDAVLVELRSDAAALADNIESEQRAQFTDRARLEDARVRKIETEPREPNLGDLLWPERVLREDFHLMREAFEPMEGDLSLTAETEALAHVAETMASKILPPKIADKTNISPLDGSAARRVLALTEALTWATTEANRLHGVWGEQHEASKAGVA